MAEVAAYPEQRRGNEVFDQEAAFQFACESLQHVNALNDTVAPSIKTALIAQAEQQVEYSAIAAREALVKGNKALDTRLLDRAITLSSTPKENTRLIAARQQNTRTVAFGARTGQPLAIRGRDSLWNGGIIMQPPRLALGTDVMLQLRFTVGTKFGHDPERVDYSIKNAAVERANGTLADGNIFAVTPKAILDKLGTVVNCALDVENREPAAKIRPLTELASFLALLPRLEIPFRDCGITSSTADKTAKILIETFLSKFATPDQLLTIPRALMALDASALSKVKAALLKTIWPHDLPFSTMMLRTTFASEGFSRFARLVAAQRPGLADNQVTVETMSELAQMLKMRLNNAP